MVRVLLSILLAFFFLSGPGTAERPARVLVLGDSLMSSNRSVGGSVAQVLQDTHGAEVLDRSTPGARFFFGLPILSETGLRIPAQVREGAWDYVVLNGGGNDLLFGCGCGTCTKVLDRLVSKDGSSGAIPALVVRLRAQGAKVIYVGYMRTPGLVSPVEGCGPLGDEMDRRLSQMAGRDAGLIFVQLSDLVTVEGDRTFHSLDLVHPSVKGSAAIATRIAERMGH